MKTNKVTNTLKAIATENGGVLTPEAVVEAARPKSSPLHNRFTWDDSEAAEQWRLQQARQLIRVSVEVVSNSDGAVPIFVSVSTDRIQPRGGYRFLANVMSDADLRDQLLNDALHDLKTLERRYKRLKELADVWSAARKVKPRAA